jgi:hypothetical protein
MYTESNDSVEKISYLMPSTEIVVEGKKYNFSYEEYPEKSEVSSVPASDRAFVVQEENQVDKLFQLVPNTLKSEAYNELRRLNMQDTELIQLLISKGNEIVKRCEELDTSKVTIKILQEEIEIDDKPFTITYLPENTMYRQSYETRIRNRAKGLGY